MWNLEVRISKTGLRNGRRTDGGKGREKGGRD